MSTVRAVTRMLDRITGDKENSELKKMLAEALGENRVLKEVNAKNG